MKRYVLLFFVLSVFLGGCGWLDGNYVSVTPHHYQAEDTENEVVSASSYLELRNAMVEMVRGGLENSIINVADYDSTRVEQGMEMAAKYVRETDPIGAYAVESVACELGTSGAVPAIAVEVVYRHDRTELQQIENVSNMDAVRDTIGTALEQYDSGIVLLVDDYSDTDLTQVVQDYATLNPATVMETPEITFEVYPASGRVRVLELKFSYETSRDSLRQMQTQVVPIFNAAALYVSGDSADYQKFSQLYAFLMERFSEYQIKTSITPAYSLLHHGVGDSRAFAMVYAQMCRRAGLDCQIITGTRQGEPWSWNIVNSGGNYYHVDLLGSNSIGNFLLMTDDQMADYVWDYSAYPACSEILAVPEETVAAESEATAPTEILE